MMGFLNYRGMRVIGIRANPKRIFYSLINISGETFSVSNDELIIPVSFDVPQKLKYVRKTMLDIFNEYNIEFAGIRVAEQLHRPSELMTVSESC